MSPAFPDLDLVRRALSALEAAAARARNDADIDGDADPMSTVLEDSLRRFPLGAQLLDPAVRHELRSADASLIAALDRAIDAHWGREGRLRASFARRRIAVAGELESLSGLMLRSRQADPARRAAAQDALLGELASFRELREQLQNADDDEAAARPAPPSSSSRPAPVPAAAKTAGGLLLPDPSMIEQILAQSAAVALDPALAKLPLALALGADTPAPQPAPIRGAGQKADGHGEPELERIAAEVSKPKTEHALAIQRELIDLARELARSVGASPIDYAGWLAAAAGAGVADFRPRAVEVLERFDLAGLRRLPFEQPGVPLARPGSRTPSGADAWIALAYLLSSGELAAPGLGGALAAITATAPFIQRGLEERPSDALKAHRTFGLALALRFLIAAIAVAAEGRVEAIRDLSQDVLGAAPNEAVATLQAAEHSLAKLPCEERALYGATTKLAAVLAAGTRAAARLRESFDDDWFRNPHVTGDAIRASLAGAAASEESPATTRDLVGWLEESTRLR